MNDAPAIQIDQLSYAYPNGARALDGVTCAVAADEKVGLVGANGAGKSTLLLHLNGVLDGSARVRIHGLTVERGNLGAVRRMVGMVFQNPDDQLFCPTVAQDVAFGPRNMRLAEAEVAARVERALASVGLAGFGPRNPFHLSLGEKKRAAIATVLSMEPQILVLDEPTANLDPRGRREIAQLLESLGGTQIVATHDLEMVRRLCSRVIVLDRGRIVADGDPDVLLTDEPFLKSTGLW